MTYLTKFTKRLTTLKEETRALEEMLARGDMAVREVEEKARKIEAEKKELDKQVGKNLTFFRHFRISAAKTFDK